VWVKGALRPSNAKRWEKKAQLGEIEEQKNGKVKGRSDCAATLSALCCTLQPVWFWTQLHIQLPDHQLSTKFFISQSDNIAHSLQGGSLLRRHYVRQLRRIWPAKQSEPFIRLYGRILGEWLEYILYIFFIPELEESNSFVCFPTMFVGVNRPYVLTFLRSLLMRHVLTYRDTSRKL